MNWTTIRDALYTWVESVEGSRPVVWADQDAPRPMGPFTSLRLNTRTKVGHDFVGHATDEGEISVRGNREIVLEVQTFGENALSRAEALRTSLSMPTVWGALSSTAGIAVLWEGDVQNISELEESRYEERGTFDVRLRVAENVTDTPGVIKHVEMGGTIKGPNGGELVTLGPETVDLP